MSLTFKPGDIVICIDNEMTGFEPLIIDYYYTVAYVTSSGLNVNLKGMSTNWISDRFLLVPPETLTALERAVYNV